MHWLKFPKKKNLSASSIKVEAALVAYGYDQTYIGILTSFFCATIVFFSVYSMIPHYTLFAWYAYFLSVTLMRIFIAMAYHSDKDQELNYKLWRKWFIFSGFLGGISWGLSGVFLFTTTMNTVQSLGLLVMAGITAGGVAIFSSIILSAIAFLVASILPFIIKALFFKQFIYSLFDLALVAYVFYLILLCFKMNGLMRSSVLLKYENDTLVKNLSSANKKLAHIATHDPLTHLDNRRLFYINVANALKRAKRNKELLAILYIDLDGFKAVNDTYGHNVGDQLLLLVVEKLKKTLRSSDLISRLGGDEFTVILEQIHMRENVAFVAQELCEIIAFPAKINEYEINVSASIGISLYPIDGTDTETLVKAADDAMYIAKGKGRNNFHFKTDAY